MKTIDLASSGRWSLGSPWPGGGGHQFPLVTPTAGSNGATSVAPSAGGFPPSSRPGIAYRTVGRASASGHRSLPIQVPETVAGGRDGGSKPFRKKTVRRRGSAVGSAISAVEMCRRNHAIISDRNG